LKLLISNKSLKFHIFSAGSPELGMGHLKRSAVLAEYIKTQNYQVRTSILSNKSDLHSLQIDASEVSILDLPPKFQKLLQRRLQFHPRVATLDSRFIKSEINISIYPHNLEISNENFVGYKYAIVADEFFKHSSPLSDNLEKFKSVCICLGGGDVKNQGPLIGQYLSSLGFDVTLIMGPFANPRHNNISYRFNVVRNPAKIWEEFHKADWLVVNGGGTLFEALSMGKVSYSLPQTTEEKLIATDLYLSGALLGFGLENVAKLSFENAFLVKKNAKSTIDGHGKRRILELLTKRYT
jgi:spore coat polysaccharide biosynthesis predicted glycosyltransferase SpsG